MLLVLEATNILLGRNALVCLEALHVGLLERNDMKDYFKPMEIGSLRYFVNWKRYFKYRWLWLKWFIQRGSRGWADCDVWSIDSYLSEVIPPMIERLNGNTHGYPADLDGGEKKWGEILTKIQHGFEASGRIRNLDNWNNESPWTAEDIVNFKAADEKDLQTMNEGLELFKEHFLSLWD